MSKKVVIFLKFILHFLVLFIFLNKNVSTLKDRANHSQTTIAHAQASTLEIFAHTPLTGQANKSAASWRRALYKNQPSSLKTQANRFDRVASKLADVQSAGLDEQSRDHRRTQRD